MHIKINIHSLPYIHMCKNTKKTGPHRSFKACVKPLSQLGCYLPLLLLLEQNSPLRSCSLLKCVSHDTSFNNSEKNSNIILCK